jgi:hypothetical protein
MAEIPIVRKPHSHTGTVLLLLLLFVVIAAAAYWYWYLPGNTTTSLIDSHARVASRLLTAVA